MQLLQIIGGIFIALGLLSLFLGPSGVSFSSDEEIPLTDERRQMLIDAEEEEKN